MGRWGRGGDRLRDMYVVLKISIEHRFSKVDYIVLFLLLPRIRGRL